MFTCGEPELSDGPTKTKSSRKGEVTAAIVIISLVTASIFSGKVFTVSQGGIVFGASDKVIEGAPLSDEDAALKKEEPEAPQSPIPAPPPTVITSVAERVAEVPVPAPAPPVEAPQPAVRAVSRPVIAPIVPEPDPEPTPEPEPDPEPSGPMGPEQ